MRIKEIIRDNKMASEVTKIERCSCLSIGFINEKNERDETQLTVCNHVLTQSGIKELTELFSSLVKELQTSSNAVTDITIVASAQTENELIAMGY